MVVVMNDDENETNSALTALAALVAEQPSPSPTRSTTDTMVIVRRSGALSPNGTTDPSRSLKLDISSSSAGTSGSNSVASNSVASTSVAGASTSTSVAGTSTSTRVAGTSTSTSTGAASNGTGDWGSDGDLNLATFLNLATAIPASGPSFGSSLSTAPGSPSAGGFDQSLEQPSPGLEGQGGQGEEGEKGASGDRRGDPPGDGVRNEDGGLRWTDVPRDGDSGSDSDSDDDSWPEESGQGPTGPGSGTEKVHKSDKKMTNPGECVIVGRTHGFDAATIKPYDPVNDRAI